jgi:hypothetical protein
MNNKLKHFASLACFSGMRIEQPPIYDLGLWKTELKFSPSLQEIYLIFNFQT